MKGIILIILICSLIFIGGCNNVRTYSYNKPMFFEDTGNKIDNMKTCDLLMDTYCRSREKCISYSVDEIVCEDEKCYCM